MEMEVRWRLFAREILSMPADDSGCFLFGRPLRPVRGLRFLGLVVHKSRMATSSRRAGANIAEGSAGGQRALSEESSSARGDVETICDGFGLMAVGE